MVVADEQTAGRGRQDRDWYSPPRGNLYLSLAVDLATLPREKIPLIPLAAGVALAETVRELTALEVLLKWPNDLLVDGRKLAGILPRMVHRGSCVRLARVGVGLNVVNRVPPGAIALADCWPAAWLRSSTALLWTSEVLMALDRVQELVGDPKLVCHATEVRLWSRQVCDPDTGAPWQVEGLRDDGALVLRQGTRTTIWTRWLDGAAGGL